MSFDRTLLPEPIGYYESQGLVFQQRRGKWRNVICLNCDSNAMRINTETGGFICMAGCGARGGDVLAYHLAAHGLPFAEAANGLGAYVEDGKPAPTRPTPIPAQDLLRVVAPELMVAAVVMADILNGKLTDDDYDRFRDAAGRVLYVAEVAHV